MSQTPEIRQADRSEEPVISRPAARIGVEYLGLRP